MIRYWLVIACAALLSSTATAQTPPDTTGAAGTAAAQQPAAPDTLTTTPATAAPAAGAATVQPAPAQTTAPPPAAAPASPPPAAQPAASTQAQTSNSGPRRNSDPFARGNIRFSGTVGWGQGFGTDYMIIGIGAGYYIKRGLDVGLYYEAWAFGDPGVTKLSPEVRLTRQLPMGLAPYVGAYYRRTYIDDFDDLDSYGGRVGAYKYSRGGRSMFGGGAVYEKYLDCDESAYTDCSNVYPEIVFATSF